MQNERCCSVDTLGLAFIMSVDAGDNAFINGTFLESIVALGGGGWCTSSWCFGCGSVELGSGIRRCSAGLEQDQVMASSTFRRLKPD